MPPSTTSSQPTAKGASSDARKTIAWAISLGFPNRLTGIAAVMTARLSLSLLKAAYPPVRSDGRSSPIIEKEWQDPAWWDGGRIGEYRRIPINDKASGTQLIGDRRSDGCYASPSGLRAFMASSVYSITPFQ